MKGEVGAALAAEAGAKLQWSPKWWKLRQRGPLAETLAAELPTKSQSKKTRGAECQQWGKRGSWAGYSQNG